MGLDWMTRDEMAQAIPPAYSEFIGRHARAALEGRAAAGDPAGLPGDPAGLP
jgi:DNA (cytosine-5)-methyltransferase 1